MIKMAKSPYMAILTTLNGFTTRTAKMGLATLNRLAILKVGR